MKKIAPIILDIAIVSAPILLLVVFLGDAFEQFGSPDQKKTILSPLSVAWIFWIVAACLNVVLAILRRVRKKARPSFAFYYGSVLNLAVASFVFLPLLWFSGLWFYKTVIHLFI